MDLLCNEWIEQVKYYMQIITAHNMKENEVGNVLNDTVNVSGKMFRAKLLLLCGLLGKDWEAKKETLFKLAAMTELTHLASLIHDDIIDESPYRRGKPSIQSKYGKNAAVYAGDFLMARIYYYEAIERLNESAAVLSKAVESMCMGEIGQGLCRYREDVSVEEYFENIQGKTATLFETACYIGAKEAGCSDEVVNKLSLFGKNLGFMFQLKDDILDFTSDLEKVGKETNKDFQNGIYTFPVIMALKNPEGQKLLSPIMKKNIHSVLSKEEIQNVTSYVINFGGVEESKKEIKRLSDINKNLIKDLENKDIVNLFFKLMKKLEK